MILMLVLVDDSVRWSPRNSPLLPPMPPLIAPCRRCPMPGQAASQASSSATGPIRFPPDDERRNSIADSTTGDDTSTFQNPLDRGSSSSSGPGQQWPIAVAAVTNPSAVRQSSLVEVWAIESGDRQDPGRLVGKFSQDAAAIAMALAPCHARPDGKQPRHRIAPLIPSLWASFCQNTDLVDI